ncbi:hypothetical protein [Microbacterium allomyrinae]|uniref:O-antigen polysaccharide polymerase Wzy n=1 Tax=Microbacterium allomyrinae TaxID=2830666 RepID=A0A9X1S526_9MICO|nr:hypothetical protein [Microbacterium allomyrinae]MCC2034062.1 hypothetical protein [Microbacterium allomyrinae]
MATIIRPGAGPKARAQSAVPLMVGLVLVIAVCAATFADVRYAPVLPYALAYVAIVAATWRRLAPVALSPAFYLSAYLCVVAVLGVSVGDQLSGAGGTGFTDFLLDPAISARTASALFVAASLCLIGAALVRRRPSHIAIGDLLDLGDLSKYAKWFLLIGVVELAVLAYIVGINEIFERDSRLLGRGTNIETIVSMLAVAVLVLVGIAFFTSKGALRFLSLVLILGFIAYFVSMGSRRLALVPLLLLLAYVFARRGKLSVIPVVIAAVGAVVTLALPLHFRGQASHGLLPYMASLSSFSLSPEMLATSLNNFVAGFKITAVTGFQSAKIPTEALPISLSPLDGNVVGWYEVAPLLRINRYTPYSAIGELINYGSLVFVVILLGLGIVLGFSQVLNDKLLTSPLGRLVAILALGLIFMFVIQSSQYNLRSVVRYIYLALGAQVIGVVLVYANRALHRREGSRATT